MKILIMAPYTPYPPNSGGRMRIWEQLRFLAKRHELTLVAFFQSEQDIRARDLLNEICHRVFLVKRPGRPLDSDLVALKSVADLFKWQTTPEMKCVLYSLQSESFDLLLLHHIFMAQYREWFPAPAVLEEHNIESAIFKQHAQLVESSGDERTFRQTRWMLLRKYETAMWKQFPLRVVVSANDKQEMAQRCRVGRTLVVENGINPREMAMLPRATTRTLFFMGSLDFYPNIDALFYLRESILPLLWKLDPTVSLRIAGRRPPNAIRELMADPRIQVIADPEDMNALARDCALTIAPMRIGSGTRIKILHSLALGRPVVTTQRGGEGLAVQDGCELVIRDEPAEFADAVLQVLDDAALAERLRRAGRRLVETRYDWTILFEKYENELTTLVNLQ